MSSPKYSTTSFTLNTGSYQTILGGVGALAKILDKGYVIFRNTGAATCFFKVQTSSDGTNFQDIPDPYLQSDGIPANTNPAPYPLPPPDARGEFIRIQGKCATSTTVDVELYQPDLSRRIGVGIVTAS